MSQYNIQVEIPDGEYCFYFEGEASCHYLDEAYVGAGCCVLVDVGDSIVHWEDEDEEGESETHQRIIKHKDCPSLKKRMSWNGDGIPS